MEKENNKYSNLELLAPAGVSAKATLISEEI